MDLGPLVVCENQYTTMFYLYRDVRHANERTLYFNHISCNLFTNQSRRFLLSSTNTDFYFPPLISCNRSFVMPSLLHRSLSISSLSFFLSTSIELLGAHGGRPMNVWRVAFEHKAHGRGDGRSSAEWTGPEYSCDLTDRTCNTTLRNRTSIKVHFVVEVPPEKGGFYFWIDV